MGQLSWNSKYKYQKKHRKDDATKVGYHLSCGFTKKIK